MRDDTNIPLIVVKDANIIFDFWDLDLMDSFLKVEYNVYVTGLVVNEIIEKKQKEDFDSYVNQGKIKIDNGDLTEILTVMESHKGCSLEDSSVLEFGIRTNATILTNDRKLKNAIKKHGLVCHGLLWCIEDLVGKGIINWKVGKEKIELWMATNERTPKELCEKLIMKIEKYYSDK